MEAVIILLQRSESLSLNKKEVYTLDYSIYVIVIQYLHSKLYSKTCVTKYIFKYQ